MQDLVVVQNLLVKKRHLKSLRKAAQKNQQSAKKVKETTKWRLKTRLAKKIVLSINSLPMGKTKIFPNTYSKVLQSK